MYLLNHLYIAFRRAWSNSTNRLFFASLVIGAIAGLGAIAFFVLLSEFSHLMLHVLANYYPPEPGGESSGFVSRGGIPRWWVLLLAPAVGGLLSGFLVFKWAPEAEGHGTDAMIESFHLKKGKIRRRIPFLKAISSVITIGSGGSAGREGPIAQIGAGFGSFLSDLFKFNDDERRILILAGAAAGIGAIFRAPLGGALFVVEVLYARDFEARALIPALISSIIAYSIFSLWYGWGTLFTIPTYDFREPVELLFYAALGLVCAGMGVFYIKVFYGFRDSFFHRIRVIPHIRPAIGGLMIGAVGVFAPHVMASGYGYMQQAIDGQLTMQFMFVAAILKIFATSFTISSGGSGGVFAPSLFIGSMVGGAFGQLATRLYPNTITDPAAFVLVGMGAFFAGVAKVPIAAMIMVSEMTGGYSLLVPMMLASAVAYIATRRASLYEKQVAKMSDSLAHIGDFTIDVLDTMLVAQAYKSDVQVPRIPKTTPLQAFQNIVSENDLNYYPVIDEAGNLVGIISLRNARSVLFENEMGGLLIAEDLMTQPVTVVPSESLHSALKKFLEFNYGQLPVVDTRDEKQILGILSHEDIIEAYRREIMKIKTLS